MRDPRTQKLAALIVKHSTALKAGEAMLIEPFDLADGRDFSGGTGEKYFLRLR